MYFIIGSYNPVQPGNTPATPSNTIKLLSFREGTGFSLISETDLCVNPSFMVFHKDCILVVSELPTASVVSLLSCRLFASKPKETPIFRLVSRKEFPGAGGCHISVLPKQAAVPSDSLKIAVSNYTSGNLIVSRITESFDFSDNWQLFSFYGSGPVSKRQSSSHIHSTLSTPDGSLLLAADLGADQVYLFDIRGNCLIPHKAQTMISLPPGSGPRHLCFHPCLPLLYIVCELSNQLFLLDYDACGRTFRFKVCYSTLPSSFHGTNTAAELHFSPDKAYLYVSNRGHNSIAVFKVHSDGTLETAGHCACGGCTPRSFALSPCGSYLLCANQDSHEISALKIHQKTGMLTGKAASFPVSNPVFIHPVSLF